MSEPTPRVMSGADGPHLEREAQRACAREPQHQAGCHGCRSVAGSLAQRRAIEDSLAEREAQRLVQLDAERLRAHEPHRPAAQARNVCQVARLHVAAATTPGSHPREGRCCSSVAVARRTPASAGAACASSAALAAAPSSTSSTTQAQAPLRRTRREATSCTPLRRAATSPAMADTRAGGGTRAGAVSRARCAVRSVRSAAAGSSTGSDCGEAAGSGWTPHTCAAHVPRQRRTRSRSLSPLTPWSSRAQRPRGGTCAANRSCQLLRSVRRSAGVRAPCTAQQRGRRRAPAGLESRAPAQTARPQTRRTRRRRLRRPRPLSVAASRLHRQAAAPRPHTAAPRPGSAAWRAQPQPRCSAHRRRAWPGTATPSPGAALPPPAAPPRPLASTPSARTAPCAGSTTLWRLRGGFR